MEGERKKKRKMEVEEEEEEVEKFFALIKSTRQVCEMLKGSPNWPLVKKRDEQGMKTSSSNTWNPSFQVEDFLDQDDKLIGVDHSAGPSLKIQQEKMAVEEKKVGDEEGNDGLDLKLSL